MSYVAPPASDFQKPKSNTATIIVIVLLVLLGVAFIGCGILAALLLPAVSAARDAAKQTMASNNLRQIGLAMHNYESAFKRFPALHSVNFEKKPTISWRFAISPFLGPEGTAVYNNYVKESEAPWDPSVPSNMLNQMPSVFRSPSAPPDQPSTHTNIFTIQDPKSAFPAGATWLKISSFIDGTSNSLLAVELPHHSIPWTQPTDLTADEAIQLIRSSPRPEKILLLLADGSVIRVDDLTDADLRAMITINGGEPGRLERQFQ